MARVPRTVHFVFGLKDQTEPFHLLHYLAIESCRRVLKPERIVLYYHHLPFGLYWDMARPHLELVRVELSPEVHDVAYDQLRVPAKYRYAHHADFIRLDALIEEGGVYADIDTLFLHPIPDDLYDQSFVIGREASILDEATGEFRQSLCNALMLAEPGSEFARAWRQRMPLALNGSWSNHSCQLAFEIANEMPDKVQIEPESSFTGIPLSAEGLGTFLESGELDLRSAYSVHLWQHVWWEESRQDFSSLHAGKLTLQFMREGTSQLCRLARPYLPSIDLGELDGIAL